MLAVLCACSGKGDGALEKRVEELAAENKALTERVAAIEAGQGKQGEDGGGGERLASVSEELETLRSELGDAKTALGRLERTVDLLRRRGSLVVFTEEVRPPKADDLPGYIRDLSGDTALIATIDTSLGEIHCELFAERTPVTVANFVGLARGLKAWRHPRTGETKIEPFYDGLTFHRVIPDFMIQAGDPLANSTGGPGYTFGDEFHADLRHDRPGVLSMANGGPGTNGSQFFITEKAAPALDGRNTIFGQCLELDAIKAIARVARDAKDRPSKDVKIKRIEISRAK